MQTPIEATFTQHVGHIALGLQHMPGLLKIAAKAQRSQNGGGHYFGFRHLTLRIIAIKERFEHIITQTKDRYNLNVHRFTCNWSGLVTFQFTPNLWTFLPVHQR